MKNKIVISSDHAGYSLKEKVIEFLREGGYNVVDLGTDSEKSVDYPDYANSLADYILNNDGTYGILLCGTGIGMSIAANRYSHIRCALINSKQDAILSRQHNDANVIAIGARNTTTDQAKDFILSFLSTDFEGERHKIRVDKIK